MAPLMTAEDAIRREREAFAELVRALLDELRPV